MLLKTRNRETTRTYTLAKVLADLIVFCFFGYFLNLWATENLKRLLRDLRATECCNNSLKQLFFRFGYTSASIITHNPA